MTGTRRCFLGIPVGATAVTAALVVGATGAGTPGVFRAPPFAVGHQLSLDDSAPVMQPVHTAAGVQKVAAVPGSQDVWAYGHLDSPNSGTAGGHSVFQHYTGAGWAVTGPPVLEDGVTSFDAGGADDISIAADGEGWAVLLNPRGLGPGHHFALVHHMPGTAGGAWRLDRASSDLLDSMSSANGSANHARLSVASDAQGTYGYLVTFAQYATATDGNSPSAFMKLTPNGWVKDANDGGTNADGQPANSAGNPGGSLAAVVVDPTDRNVAWAVGSAFAVRYDQCTTNLTFDLNDCLRDAQAVASQSPGSVVYHHTGSGWAAVSTVGSSLTPSSGPQSASAVATDRHGGAYIAGVTGSTFAVRGSADPTVATVAPFVMHMDSSASATATYCATCPGHPFPLTEGLATVLTSAPASGGDAGDVFLGGAAPSVMYHLRLPDDGSGFKQEPITVGPITSLAMSSATEGWAAAVSTATDTPVVGHYTRSQEASQSRRWPTPTSGQFSSVAEDPSGSGVVMAVGSTGIWRLDPATGLWSAMPLPAGDMPRSISWPTHSFAVAVGGRTILQFDGTSWHRASVDGTINGDLNSVAASASPLASVAAPTPVGAPTAAPTAATALLNQLVGWGGNGLGQLGLGTTVNAHAPAPVPLLGSTILAVSAGGDPPSCATCHPDKAHTLAIACPCDGTTGSVWAWGADDRGQAGQNPPKPDPQCLAANQQPVPCLKSPQQVQFPGAPVTFKAVAAGRHHSLALDSLNRVWAWGDDASGQLGDGSATNKFSAAPQLVMQPGSALPLTASAIAAGGDSSAALDLSTGQVWWWGFMGVPTPVPTAVSGLTNVTKLAVGTNVGGANFGVALAKCQQGDTCANGQELFAWGVMQSGSFSTPCNDLKGSGIPWCPPEPLTYQRDDHGQPLNVSAIAVGPDLRDGSGHHLGTVAVADGQLWDVSGDNKPGAALPSSAYKIPGLSNVRDAAVGGNFLIAEELDGSLWAMGNNPEGQLAVDPQVVGQTWQSLRVQGVVTHGPIAAGSDQAFAFADSFSRVTQGSGSGSGPGTGPGAPASAGGPGAQAWAVGANGTTVRYAGSRWSVQPSPTQLTLAAVTATGRDFVAAGYAGVMLVDTGAGFTQAPTPETIAYRGPGQTEPIYPRLYAAASLADGTVLLGGEYGTLLRRDPGDPPTAFRLVGPGIDGSIHALAMRRDSSGRLRLLVSTGWVGGVQSPSPNQTALDYSGWLMSGDGSQWRDADVSHAQIFEAAVESRAQPHDEFQVQRDAVQGVAFDPSGVMGWAVGDNGSAWRVALDREPPASPMAGAAAIAADPGAIGSFAFTANMGCVQGTCADMLGWGSRGDVVSMESLRAIDSAARSGALGLLVSGGDLRRVGDSSLNAMPGLFSSLSIPTYAAIGTKDLTPGVTGACNNGANDNATWRAAFHDRPAPWGSGTRPSSITLPAPAGPPCPVPNESYPGANTHYAFDWHGSGGVIRFVFLDTSQPQGLEDSTNQSPSGDVSQIQWLSGLLQPSAPPTVLVMNKPVVCAGSANDTGLTGLLATPAAVNVVGILASAQPANWHCDLLPTQGLGRTIPVYMFGGGGGRFETSTPMSSSQAMDPRHGDYFSWQDISVAPDPTTGVTTLMVRSIPVLESVVLGAPQGTVAQRGNTIRFSGSGRIPDMGQIDQTEEPHFAYKPTRIDFPFASAPDPNGSVVPPSYAFSSDDNSIVAPVKVDSANHPVLNKAGQTTLDPLSGTFCSFRPGTTTIHLTAGTVTSRLPVTVTTGSGSPCGALAPLPRVKIVNPAAVLPVQPRPQPAGAAPLPAPRPHIARGPQGQQIAAIPIPPPAGVVPAPPGGMGQGAGQKEKEEESEAAMEDAKMTALRPSRRVLDDAWLPLGAAGLGTALAAYCIARGRRRRLRSVRAAVVTAGTRPRFPNS